MSDYSKVLTKEGTGTGTASLDVKDVPVDQILPGSQSQKTSSKVEKAVGDSKEVKDFMSQFKKIDYDDPSKVKEELEEESRYSRFLRWLAHIAGIATPLGVSDYNKAFEEYGSDDGIRNEFIIDGALHTQLMLNMPRGTVQFDWYDICKESRTWFIYLLLSIYFLSSCIFFGIIGEYCFDMPSSATEFIPRAFFLLTGLIQYDKIPITSFCTWANFSASFFGMYISLPLFGAVLLVRLLAPMGSPPNVSKHFTLSLVNGTPILSFRVNNPNGRVVTGLEIELAMWIVADDTHADTKVATCHQIELNYGSKWLSGIASRPVHVIDEKSPLKKLGVVYIDDNGIPRIDHKKIGVIELLTAFDSEYGGRKLYSLRNYYNTKFLIVEGKMGDIDSEHEGKILMPSWKGMVVALAVKWRTSKGEVTPTADNSRMNVITFEPYNKREVPLTPS
jgi:hypothetical protein